jgi:hypothetical protein
MDQISKLFEHIPSHLKSRYNNAIVVASIYGTIYGFYRWWNLDSTKYKLEDKPDDTDVDKLLKGVMNLSLDSLLLTTYVSGGGLIGSLFVGGFPVTFPAYYLYHKRKNSEPKNIDN